MHQQTLRALGGLSLALALFITSAGCGTTTPRTPADDAPATIDRGAIPTTVPLAPARQQAGLDTVRAERFDSGKMWTFEEPPVDYWRQEYGLEVNQAWLERARLGALRIPGCSASLVSATGLVMTNHHCARSYVTQVSREGEFLLDNGFYAETLADERPVSRLYADRLVAITDVTEEVEEALAVTQTDAERMAARQEVFDTIRQRLLAEAGPAGHVVEVISLYNGGRHSAYTFRRFEDVRLVMAPELQLGYFGGDADNFTYPRYALDMAFLRIYEGGRPMTTDTFFPWSREGVSDGMVVFVVGNPGSTNRLETIAQLEYRRDVQERYLLEHIGRAVVAMQRYFDADPVNAERLGIRNQMFSLRNAQKLYIGRLAGLNDPVLMARRADTERQFLDGIRQDDALVSHYGGLVDEMAALQVERMRMAAEFGAFMWMTPASANTSATLRRSVAAQSYVQAREAGASPERLAELRRGVAVVRQMPASLDRDLLEQRIADFPRYFGPGSAMARHVLGDRTPSELAQTIISQSILADSLATANALESGTLTADDPGLRFAASFATEFDAYQRALAGLNARQAGVAAELGRARFALYGTEIPPDATFSLRIADGVVRGYSFNGTWAPYKTNFYGLYDRYHSHGRTGEWALPQRWLEDRGLDMTTPLNIVSTNDIIGGNSGSPLLNSNLEIVGLVFDGNIESLPSSFIYRTEGARAVSVDSRGMLEALDTVYRARRIVEEIRLGQREPVARAE
jgi:hypothetical protein